MAARIPGPIKGLPTDDGKGTLGRQQAYPPGPLRPSGRPHAGPRRRPSAPGTSNSNGNGQPARYGRRIDVEMEITEEELKGRPSWENEIAIIQAKEFIKALAASVAGAAPAIKDVATDLRALLKELGFTGRYVIKRYKGVDYIVIKGYAGLRSVLTGTRYAVNNPKVVSMVIGRVGLIKSAIAGTRLSIILVAASDVLQFILSDEGTLRDLGLTLGADVAKAFVGGVAGYAAGMVATGVTSIACAPVVAGILVGLAVGFTLDAVAPTDKIVDVMNRRLDAIQALYDRQMDKGASWMQWLEDEILNLYRY